MTLIKADLRAQMRMLRERLTKDEVAVFSAAIIQKITATDWYKEANTIAIFYPMTTEVNLLDLMNNPKKRFVFPRIIDKKQKLMGFAVLDRGFVPGIFGTSEPDGLMVSPEAIDLILVPGLCFSRQGDRIGYGAGYYDNYLRTTHAHTIGVGYSFQLFDQLPREDHDVLLGRILTVSEDVCLAR